MRNALAGRSRPRSCRASAVPHTAAAQAGPARETGRWVRDYGDSQWPGARYLEGGAVDASETGPVSPIPDRLHTVTPRLVVSDGAAAIAFYGRAFGAQELG